MNSKKTVPLSSRPENRLDENNVCKTSSLMLNVIVLLLELVVADRWTLDLSWTRQVALVGV